MRLVFTHYFDGAPTADRLERAIHSALDSAADRIAAQRDDTVTETIAGGVRIHRGLAHLAGSELRLSSSAELTELRVEIPWSSTDTGSPKLWAANRFAGVLAEQLAVAA